MKRFHTVNLWCETPPGSCPHCVTAMQHVLCPLCEDVGIITVISKWEDVKLIRRVLGVRGVVFSYCEKNGEYKERVFYEG